MAIGSQFNEDKWIQENIKLPDIGFYLDIGAADPIRYSNTYFLQKAGWMGLCIDGNKKQYNKLLNAGRNALHAVVTKEKKQIAFYEYQDPDLSGIKEMQQTTLSVRKIIKTTLSVPELKKIIPTKIDFCSLDIEGSELDVLQGMYENDIYPCLLVVEHKTAGRQDMSKQILKQTEKMGYQLLHTTFANYILKRKICH